MSRPVQLGCAVLSGVLTEVYRFLADAAQETDRLREKVRDYSIDAGAGEPGRAEEWRRLDRVSVEVEGAVRRAVYDANPEAGDLEVLRELSDAGRVEWLVACDDEGPISARSCLEAELGRVIAQWRLWRRLGEPVSEEV